MDIVLDIAMAALLIGAAIADFKTHEVADAITMSCVAVAAVRGIRSGQVIGIIAAGIIVLFVLVCPDSSKFGQADWLVYAALIARYGLFSLPILALVPSACALLCIGATAMRQRSFDMQKPIPYIPFIVGSLPITDYVIKNFWI